MYRANCQKHVQHEHLATTKHPSLPTEQPTEQPSNQPTELPTDKPTDTDTPMSDDGVRDNVEELPPDTVRVPIEPIDSLSMLISRPFKRTPLVLLKPLNGPPVVVRVHEEGNQQAHSGTLAIINTREFERDQDNLIPKEKFKLQIKFPIVATMVERQAEEDLPATVIETNAHGDEFTNISN
ncbi:hypothetical protein CBL_13039 [Carabus blaptoides fortunei]